MQFQLVVANGPVRWHLDKFTGKTMDRCKGRSILYLAFLATRHISSIGQVQKDCDVLPTNRSPKTTHLPVGPARMNIVFIAILWLRARTIIVLGTRQRPVTAINNPNSPTSAGIKLPSHL